MSVRTITIDVTGEFFSISSKLAGVQGSANSAALSIVFNTAWDDYTKRITFWNSRGMNPVSVLLTDNPPTCTVSEGQYIVPIPGEPMEYGGWLTFKIEGYAEETPESVLITVSGRLFVEPGNTYSVPADVTPSQALQLLAALEAETAARTAADALKADSDDVYTKDEVDDLLAESGGGGGGVDTAHFLTEPVTYYIGGCIMLPGDVTIDGATLTFADDTFKSHFSERDPIYISSAGKWYGIQSIGEDNTMTLTNSPTGTTSTVGYYTDGSDENDGLSITSPFASAAAVQTIIENLYGVCSGTYITLIFSPAPKTAMGVSDISLQGRPDLRIVIRQIGYGIYPYIDGNVSILDFGWVMASGISMSGLFSVRSGPSEGDSHSIEECTARGFSFSNCVSHMSFCYSDEDPDYAVIAQLGAVVTSEETGGSGTIYGLYATTGSTIIKSGDQPTGGTDNEYTVTGGQIVGVVVS